MKQSKNKGQALTEFSLVLPTALIFLLLLVDPAIALFNYSLGIYSVFKATRAASVYMAEDSTCHQVAEGAATGSFSNIPFIMVDSDSIELIIDPCPDSPLWSPISGSEITTTLKWDQDKIVAWDFHNREIVWKDHFLK